MEEAAEAPKNPLEIPEILERISRNCSFKDLKAFRQVSTFWEECSRKAFVSSSKVRIHDFGFGYGEPTDLPKCWKFAKTINGIPHENYLLHGHHFTRYQMGGLHTSFVKHLELTFWKFENEDVFRTVIFKSLQNLKHLEIDCGEFVSNERGSGVVEEPVQRQEPAFGLHRNLKTLKVRGSLDISKLELLSHFPSFEVLDLILTYDDPSGTEIRSWVESIERIRGDDRSALKLKTLRINAWGKPDSMNPIWRVLEDPQLPLEEIELKFYTGDAEERLRDIIWNRADTLKRLHLSGNPNPANIFRGPGNMELKIEELSLSFAFMFSLEFLKRMPALKSIKLSLSPYGTQGRPFHHEVGDICLPECTKVEFEDYSVLDRPAAFEPIMRCFPNIQDLTVHHVDDQKFLWICEHCPGLVKLTLQDITFSEAVFTGLSFQDSVAINANWKNRDHTELWKPTSSRQPNISSLKSLRKIHLHAHYVSRFSLDYSVIAFGFQELPNLKEMCVEVLKIQPDVKKALKRIFPFCEIRY